MSDTWEPVTDGVYGVDYNTITVSDNGAVLEIKSNYGDGLTVHQAMCGLEDELRLSRRVPQVWLDAPTGPGWWMLAGVDTEDDNYAYHCPFEIVEVNGGLGVHLGEVGFEEPVTRYVGKWMYLYSLWPNINWPKEGNA